MRLRALRRRSCRYLLLADIDQFYPSIYTHAVPWALHTNAASKAALKKGGKKTPLLGDILDRGLQSLNSGQTHGIPIGPDTSLVIAEVLLTAVDRDLLARNPKLAGFRFVDDYELAFRTLREAEQALVDLQSMLAGYELLLNPRKTKIVDLPQRLDSDWAIELKALAPGSDRRPIAQRNQVIAFFSRAFAVAAEHPSDSVLRYAVSSVQGLKVDTAGWRSFHNCVLGAAGADASTLAVALGTLFTVSKRGGHAVPVGPLSDVIDSVIARHAPRLQASEVAWALWAALAWNVPLSTEAARLIEPIEDDVVALLALHAEDRQLWKAGTLNQSTWAGICSQPGVLESEHWLLAYEANQQGWLNVPAVAKTPAFAALSGAGVKFYNRFKANPQFPLAGRTIPGGDLASDYA